MGLVSNANFFEAIFICFGALTIAVSIMVLIFLPDTPANARFLTKDERAQAVARVETNMTGIKNDKWKREQVMEALCDPNAWLLTVAYLATIIPNNGLLTVSYALAFLYVATHSFAVQHYCYPGPWLFCPKDTAY
jgi:sugar phosphate permease